LGPCAVMIEDCVGEILAHFVVQAARTTLQCRQSQEAWLSLSAVEGGIARMHFACDTLPAIHGERDFPPY
jgi:hypothetical protein